MNIPRAEVSSKNEDELEEEDDYHEFGMWMSSSAPVLAPLPPL